MKRFLTALGLFFLIWLNGNGQSLKTIQVKFHQTTIADDKSNVVRGTIYFDGAKTTVQVIDPIRQWLILAENKITLYYPDERRRLEILSQNPVNLPFFQAFIGVVRLDYGLTELGFTLAKNEMKGDTLLAYWQPPKEAQKALGYFILALRKNKILYTQFYNARGAKISQTIYSNHVLHAGSLFPLEIVTTQYASKDSTVEKTVYSEPVFDAPLPDKVIGFTIPLSIKPEVIRW